ncbi:sensor histidine kinase [Simiduia aestuariiviva]|uniref:histidine kinase n=1 Tax=Simiduia aestuariiviva TaxID=1510459 RepID=A0A839URV7_9GAMM|nr:ATP-binding protein [Simiduia aestuariiviva]MBB3169220.1 nitrogen fixation/metabolism regulation signal transduction histidine kinase [Simiduia aestuariiviva]
MGAWRLSLAVRLTAVCVLCSALGTLLAIALAGNWVDVTGWHSGALIIVLLLAGSVTAFCCYRLLRPLSRTLDALTLGLLNFRDNDFSVYVPQQSEPQLADLVKGFNCAAEKMRVERQYIYQRELLLDKVIQSSPNVMLLLDDHQRVIYANDAARHFFNEGHRIDGAQLDSLLTSTPSELANALRNGGEGLFSLGEEEVETWHLGRGQFLLNGQYHHLVLLKHMTRELSRQEVAVWKKVIRVISHELNNSLAPIASMVNSGKQLISDTDEPKLRLIFDTIEDRAKHLNQFIHGYARFAKLPLPRRSVIDWPTLLAQLAEQCTFTLISDLPHKPVSLDRAQIEQVLLNLFKNASESGSSPDEITLALQEEVRDGRAGIGLILADRGAGMSSDVLSQALLPFYSTKQSGTGLGLPLCREIVEAHDGHLSLQNREQGGLSVHIWLPVS